MLAEMKLMRLIAGATLLAASASGCGSGSGPGPGTSGGACTTFSPNACTDGCNPCSRLSDAQVAAVIGTSTVGQWDSDACLWEYDDAQGYPLFEVSFLINSNYATFEDFCHPADPVGDPYTVTPVSGVGDDACYLTTSIGALGSEIDFLKGCWAYSVSINGPAGQSPPFSDATVQIDEKTLALDAVPNL